MREVLTVIGPTADPENRSASLPYAVREWCINTAAVNPATHSVFVPSEDGHIYRWDLVSNSLTQFLQLNPGIGEPYVPSIVGPDGAVFTLNGGTLSAMGNLNGVGVALTSSIPDVRRVVTGDSLTLTVAVTDTAPTGTVTLQDTVYSVPSPGVLNSRTTTLLSNATPDLNGQVIFSTSALAADKHFITVTRYLTPDSDLVALMILAHQTRLHNLISRVNWETRLALDQEASMSESLGVQAATWSGSTRDRIYSAVEKLLRSMLFTDEIPREPPVQGTSAFAMEFAAAGPRDKIGRSLRDLDLKRRMFRYPCSFLIYSEAFDALPKAALDYFYRRLWDVLNGKDKDNAFATLTTSDRKAILDILRETKANLPGYWRASGE